MENTNAKYIAEGSFGCVFSSSLKCLNENENMLSGTRKYVSKVSEYKMMNNEIEIGKSIKTNINSHDYYFAPILNSCKISIGVIDEDEIKKCDLVKKNGSTNQYVSSTLKYVGTKSLYEYLNLHRKNEENQVKCIFETHIHLTNALDKILNIDDSIIHYDLKNDNIIFDDFYNVPIIIDLGLSFTKSQLLKSPINKESLDKIFYVYYEKYTVWNIEVVLLSYITQKIVINEDVNIGSQILKPYYETLVNVVVDFVTSSLLFETKDDGEIFIKSAMDYLLEFNNKPIYLLVNELCRKWKTWDNYSLAALYYIYLIDNDNLNDTNYIIPYREMLKKIIQCPLNGERLEPKDVRESIILLSRLPN